MVPDPPRANISQHAKAGAWLHRHRDGCIPRTPLARDRHTQALAPALMAFTRTRKVDVAREHTLREQPLQPRSRLRRAGPRAEAELPARTRSLASSTRRHAPRGQRECTRMRTGCRRLPAATPHPVATAAIASRSCTVPASCRTSSRARSSVSPIGLTKPRQNCDGLAHSLARGRGRRHQGLANLRRTRELRAADRRLRSQEKMLMPLPPSPSARRAHRAALAVRRPRQARSEAAL